MYLLSSSLKISSAPTTNLLPPSSQLSPSQRLSRTLALIFLFRPLHQLTYFEGKKKNKNKNKQIYIVFIFLKLIFTTLLILNVVLDCVQFLSFEIQLFHFQLIINYLNNILYSDFVVFIFLKIQSNQDRFCHLLYKYE